MQRRKFITAVGTIGVGSGMALGTGAVDAVTSSNGDSSFRVVAPGADITIDPPSSSSSPVETGTSIDFGALEIGDLPKVAVTDADGMVQIEVAVELGTTPGDVGTVFTVTNNSSTTAYDVGFTYTGYGETVTGGEYDTIDQSVAQSAFQLIDGETDSSPSTYSPTGGGTDPANRFSLPNSSDSKEVALSIDAGLSELTNNLGNDGTFDQDVSGNDFSSTSYSLIEEVTANAQGSSQ